ncbi:heparanase-like protein 2 [Lolium perenne]|uniref:heparanase-like protein 2 n=1 Tax=Lolium perenne TaxID=4522 RepID=UPI0021EA6042|nr:heparanase-like protein 2 [Lolium perenne]
MAAPAGAIFLCALAIILLFPGPSAAAGEKATVSVRAVTAISHTDDNFICATLDWWPKDKCNYGMCPWHDSSILNLDLYNPILVNAVKAFKSLRIRLGGSMQDQVTYKVGKHYDDCHNFRREDGRLFGFTDGCLPMNRWDELNIFFRRTNTTVTFGLNALRGRRKAPGNGSTLHVGGWDGRNARDLMRYTVGKGYRVESWELGNELCAGGVEAKVKAAQYGKDVLRLRRIVERVYNGTGGRLPKVLAPGGFYDGPWFSEMLRVSGPGVVDGVTHHIYNLGSGKDKDLINKMQDPFYLDKVAQTFSDMEATVRESGPWSSPWVGESGGAYNSGGKDVSDRFADSFWYLDQLGMSSVFGTKVYCRQALVGGNYCLLNTTTLAPNPDYYSALLWDRLMGPGVLQTATTGGATSPYLRSYAHCSKQKPGVTVLLINLSNSTAFNVTVAGDMDLHPPPRKLLEADAGAVCGGQREEYHLRPEGGDIQSSVVLLNGEPLALGPCGQIPELRPAVVADGCASPLRVEPHSIAFVRFTGFKAPACA